MLQSLHIKNLALIKEEEVCFRDGLNILTGETGAGKSVIIGSVNLALGGRADADMIRTGEDHALVELVFTLSEEQERRVEAMGLSVEEDHSLLIARKLTAGKSTSRVNGETVTASRLRELSEILIDIHGQKDHASLLRPAKQKEILDGYCGSDLSEAQEGLRELYRAYRETEQILAETDMDASARAREMDLLRYEVEEIEAAQLVEGEEEQLEKSYRRMSNARRIQEAVGTAAAVIGGGGSGGEDLTDALGHARRELAQVMSDDEEIQDLVGQIDDIDNLLRDLGRSLADAQENLVFDEGAFRQAQERLDLLHRLQDKYGATVAEILRSREEKEERLTFLDQMEARRERARQEREELLARMRTACEDITAKRRKGAAELSERIRESLVDCNFLDVRFAIAVEPSERDEDIRVDGWDVIRYDIQTNPGEAVRELSQIASGGELSRIMLGVKAVLADQRDTPTLIFDEIDTGISGKTAWKVSEKLGQLSRDHQIICITHLPQIAAMADAHFGIEKGIDANRTVTRIWELSEEESVGELARLLSADEVTDEVLRNAAQLKERARRGKA